MTRRGFHPDLIDAGEQLLAQFAAQFGPKDLRRLAKQVVDRIDPDGTLPNEDLQRDRRFFRMRPTKDGSYVGEFRLTGDCGDELLSLPPLANHGSTARGLRPGSWSRNPTPVHTGSGCRCPARCGARLLRTENAVPDSGGTPATVIVTIDLDDLLKKGGYALSSDGTLIRTDTALAAADQADIYWAITHSTGQILHLGRSRRIASLPQTIALYARDKGCSFPGCDTPPGMVRRHPSCPGMRAARPTWTPHPACSYHHHNFLAKGWDCRMNQQGLPEWLPPWWIHRNRLR